MINAARLKDEFLELVSISSPSRREGTIARRLEGILKAMGASVEVDGAGEKIGDFGVAVDAKLAETRAQLPEDLIFARTSDQPRQVEENIHLFMGSLYEAVVLVVLVSLVGFWEWRSALLMAVSIPITLP